MSDILNPSYLSKYYRNTCRLKISI